MTASTVLAQPSRAETRSVGVALLVWLVLVLGLAAMEAITIERRAIVPLAIVGQTVALILLYRRRGALFAVARSIDIRVPILLHALRGPVGIAFLVLGARGVLDATWAGIAGWGDLAVGIGALVVALGGARPGRAWTRVRAAWNVFGLLDIVVVLANAQYVLFLSGHPETMAPLVTFPGPLVPLVLVPLVLATHVLMIGRLRARPR